VARILFSGGAVFDGTGAPPARADVVVENGRFVALGSGLDADEAIDVTGRTLLPGLFDCHTHVVISHVDAWRALNTPFSYPFYEAVGNLAATLRLGITTVRDAGGADLGVKQAVADGLIPGPRLRISLTMLSRPAATATTGSRRARAPRSCRSTRASRRGSSTAPTRCAARSGSW
jgi:imidazolonepropionase-like amidohydrolase